MEPRIGSMVGLTPNGDITVYTPDHDQYIVAPSKFMPQSTLESLTISNRSHTPRWPTVTPTEAAQVPKAVEIARGILATLRDAPQVIADALEEAGVDVNLPGLRHKLYHDVEILAWLKAIVEKDDAAKAR